MKRMKGIMNTHKCPRSLDMIKKQDLRINEVGGNEIKN